MRGGYKGRTVVAATVTMGLFASSCGADRASVCSEKEPARSADVVVESQTAAARLAELRARFPLLALRAPVVTRFEADVRASSARHMRAVLPSAALRGVRRTARVALPMRADGEVTIEDETSRLTVRFVLENVH